MNRKSTNKKEQRVQTRPNGTKPVFPAYAPSHFQVNKQTDEAKSTKEVYENNQLYVTNLPTDTNMHEINELFPDCVGIALGVNDNSESHAAYLEFQDPETTMRACQRTRGASLRGNTLIIAPKLKYN